jgi:hypothetical protein
VPDASKPESNVKASFPAQKDFQPITADFGEDKNQEIEEWLHESIRVYKDTFAVMFEKKVPEWRRLADGKPKEKSKSFPWPNASNLVVQVIGQRCDDIAARVLGLVWSTSPVAMFRSQFAKPQDPHRESEKVRILEQFIDNQAFDHEALDLYRVECVGFADSARLGTHFFKVVPEHRMEVTEVSLMGSDKGSKRTKLTESTIYTGPRVENLEFEHVMADPDAPTWDKSRLKTQKRTLRKYELEERVFAGFYDNKKVQEIIDHPDRQGPEFAKQRQETKKGINAPQARILAEWDIYECIFWWWINGPGGKKVKVHLFASYHFTTRTMIRQVFNFMPDNACPIIPTKLDISSKGIHGRGYADMLEADQNGISTWRNQRIDARTMAITGIIRSSNPNLDKDIKVFPFCIIPGDADEIELLKNPNDIGTGGIEEEQFMLKTADDRAGVSQAIMGMGAGGLNKKGQYGAAGTLALLQDGNTRNNLRVSDFRYSHIKLVSLCTKVFGKFGVNNIEEVYGKDAALLEEALGDFYKNHIKIPIRATTASVNKEVEKQNDMLLRSALSQHFQESAQIIQNISTNAAMPPNAKKFFTDALKSQDAMMMRVLRNFGYDQPREFVPEFETGEANAPQAQGQPNPDAIRKFLSMAGAQQLPGAGVPVDAGGGVGNVPGGPASPPPGPPQ